MKFQILNILIYGTNKRIRSIELKPNAVNIITGPSGTGKSALIRIVDYCLGRKECNVPEGPIREHVDKNFQVIVTEHADIMEDWYQSLVRENWWEGEKKLIPVEWIEAKS